VGCGLVFGFAKDDSYARWFGFMQSQTGECRIAPVGKTYNLCGSEFQQCLRHSRNMRPMLR
jgi:hypothetical protein